MLGSTVFDIVSFKFKRQFLYHFFFQLNEGYMRVKNEPKDEAFVKNENFKNIGSYVAGKNFAAIKNRKDREKDHIPKGKRDIGRRENSKCKDFRGITNQHFTV